MARPRPSRPISRAAPFDKSIIALRPPMRSFTNTTTDCPVSCIVTRTWDPSGMLRLAAVMPSWSNTAPLLVRNPSCRAPYQDAIPTVSARDAAGNRVATANADRSCLVCDILSSISMAAIVASGR